MQTFHLLLLCICLCAKLHAQLPTSVNIHFYDTVIHQPFVYHVEPAINGSYTIPESAKHFYAEIPGYTLIYPHQQISDKSVLRITAFQDSLSKTIQPGSVTVDLKQLSDSLSRKEYLRLQLVKAQQPKQADLLPEIINGILDGVYIKEELPHVDPNTVLPKHYVKYDAGVNLQSISRKPLEEHKNAFQPKVDQLLQPFYMSNREVTNKAYREFVFWVRDSIALGMIYASLPNDEEALTLLNCPKKEQKRLDPTKRLENLEQYGLNHDLCYGKNSVYTNEDYAKRLENSGFYYPKTERFYYRREVDVRNLEYDYGADSPTRLYPDTLCWLRDHPVSNLDPFTNLYFWHPAYNNYPVVGLSLAQMKAYCVWLQRRTQNDITVSLPSLYHYEMAVKACVISEQKNRVIVHQTSFAAYERSVDKMLHFILPTGVLPEHFKQMTPNSFLYNWYRSYQTQPITDLAGGVSEVINNQVPAEIAADSMYTIGGNWSTYVIDKQEQPYNTTFYRQTVPLSGNATTGFRIMLVPQVSSNTEK